MPKSRLIAIKPTQRINSVIYQSIDNTALSMTLAEGLVRRLKRETLEAQQLFDVKLKSIFKQRIAKSSKALTAIKLAAANSGLIVYEIKTDVGGCIVVIGVKDECFKVTLYYADRKGMRSVTDDVGTSVHAIARYIYRRRCTDYHEVFREFVYGLQTAGHLAQQPHPNGEFTVVTTHGIGIFKSSEIGKAVCVTWVDEDKMRPEQDTSEPYLDVMARSAKARGMSIMACYGFTDHEIAKAYRRFVKLDPALTLEDFADSKHYCSVLINELTGNVINPLTTETNYVIQAEE